MRTRTIVLAGTMICLLLVCFMHPGRAPVPVLVVPQMMVKPALAPTSQTGFQTVAPAKNVRVETAEELVLAKLRAWDDDDNPDLREQRIQELAALLDGTNAWDIIQSVPANLMGYVFAVPSVRARLMSDPASALDWMSQHQNVQSQLQTFLHDWDQSDKNAMLQTINAMPSGSWREQVMAAAANETLTTDPASAVALAMQMGSAPEQNPWLGMAITEWAKQDSYAAAQAANLAGNVNLQQQLFKDVAAGMADNNPQQAADFALQFITDGKTLNESIGDITWAWALQDPASASVWLAQLPDGETQQSAVQNLMDVWGNHDPDAATTWVENLPQGAFQTQAASDLLPVVSH